MNYTISLLAQTNIVNLNINQFLSATFATTYRLVEDLFKWSNI